MAIGPQLPRPSSTLPKEPVDVTRRVVGLLGVQLTSLGKYRTAAVRNGPLLSSNDPWISRSRPLPGSMRARIFVRRRRLPARERFLVRPMDLGLKRIAFSSVVGVTGAAVAAGAGRERNQQINLGEKFDEIAGANGTCFHKVLMRVTRIASAHEYVHHVVNMNLSFFERQLPLRREGQIRVTAVVVFRPLQQQVGVGVASRADDVVHPSAILRPPIPVEGVMMMVAIGRSFGNELQSRSPVLRCVACRARVLPL